MDQHSKLQTTITTVVDGFWRGFREKSSGKNTTYISCSCNLTPHSADWGRNLHIAYGSCNSVVLYDSSWSLKTGKVIATKHTNKDRVNVVQWLKTLDGSPEKETVSSSTDGKIVVWNLPHDSLTILDGHTGSVNALDCSYLTGSSSSAYCEKFDPGPAVVVSASADSTVKVWRRVREGGQFTCTQTLPFKSGLCLSLRLCLLPGTQCLLLACGMDDAKIHLYVENVVKFIEAGKTDETSGSHFSKVHVLTGHEDWVRAMDFCIDDAGDILLASGSQDTMIRIWRISPRTSDRKQPKPMGELGPLDEIHAEEQIFTVTNTDGRTHQFTISIESVMAGHDGWIYGISWQPAIFENGSKVHQPMKLLSCSLDKTMITWSPEQDSDVWLETVRVGEMGGNTLGFYGCKFSPSGQKILGHGFQGALHLWKYLEERNCWEPGVAFGGHFRDVVDLQWEPEGEFLVSVGEDQTTRLHAPWVQGQGENEVTWHELARPQVHGYDLSCLAVLSRYRFASGAEEKVIRAFEAPKDFIQNLGRISRVLDSSKPTFTTVLGASVPSLGLSNKAVYEGTKEMLPEDRHIKDEYPESYFIPTNLDTPPTEENLLQNTLWPEVQKLYGHGYELFSLAARRDGQLLASACKASSAEHAAIILWETENWQQIQTLSGHQLTVTQMSFSPDGSYLLSVSRDRTWCLFEFDPNSCDYSLVAHTNKKTSIHSRIIWCCSWSHDSKWFATASREGRLVIWGKCLGDNSDPSLGGFGPAASFVVSKGTSITAVCFAPNHIQSNTYYLLAIGLETGNIVLANWDPTKPSSVLIWLEMGPSEAHHLTVKRLAFRPVFGEAGYKTQKDNTPVVQLASCSSDHAVKVHNIRVCKDQKYTIIEST